MIGYPDTEELKGALQCASEAGDQAEIDEHFVSLQDTLEFIVTLNLTMGVEADKLELARSLRELSRVMEALACREHQLRLS